MKLSFVVRDNKTLGAKSLFGVEKNVVTIKLKL